MYLYTRESRMRSNGVGIRFVSPRVRTDCRQRRRGERERHIIYYIYIYNYYATIETLMKRALLGRLIDGR